MVLVTRFLLVLVLLQNSQSALAERITQSRINEMAAEIYRVQQQILVKPGLRREGEPLEAYIERLAKRREGEALKPYHQRLEAYLVAFEQMQTALNAVAKPSLQDKSSKNQAHWDRINKLLGYLPFRTKKVRAALHHHTNNSDGSKHRLFHSEVSDTLRMIRSLYDNLRMARP